MQWLACLFCSLSIIHPGRSIKSEPHLATHKIKSYVTVFPAVNLISNTQNYEEKNYKILEIQCHVDRYKFTDIKEELNATIFKNRL
jgi:hypothetical protein